jgi:putative effector of murein hydrolase
MNPAAQHARKRAELLSITGAAIAGAAAGAWLAAQLRPWAGGVLLVGLAAHAVGMTTRHRIDRVEGPLPRVWQALYVLCWFAIAGVVGALLLRRWSAGA